MTKTNGKKRSKANTQDRANTTPKKQVRRSACGDPDILDVVLSTDAALAAIASLARL